MGILGFSDEELDRRLREKQERDSKVRRARELGLRPVALPFDAHCDTCGGFFRSEHPMVEIGFDFDCIDCAIRNEESDQAAMLDKGHLNI